MKYISTYKSVFCTLMLGTIIATVMPASHIHACATPGIPAKVSLVTRICSWAKEHRTLCLASISLPIFGLYARKTIRKLFAPRARRPEAQDLVDIQPIRQPGMQNQAQEEVDYFDKFADAFSKTTALVGKIFKVVSVLTETDDKWVDAAAKL